MAQTQNHAQRLVSAGNEGALCPPVTCADHELIPRLTPDSSPIPLLRSYSHPIRELCSRRACAPATKKNTPHNLLLLPWVAQVRARAQFPTDGPPRATPLRRNSSFRPVSRDACVWERVARFPTPVPRLGGQNEPPLGPISPFPWADRFRNGGAEDARQGSRPSARKGC